MELFLALFLASEVTSLDLTTFDISNVLYMDDMFINSIATTGIAGTQADADRFNATSEKLSTLVFTPVTP